MKQRVIKFRIWDKNYNGFLCCGGLIKHGMELLYMWEEQLVSDKDCTVQQFTGLQDKNKKDIYEGDIIKYSWVDSIIVPPTKHSAIKEVKWLKNQFTILEHPCSFGAVHFSHFKKEIIGNIFENPELL